jgi:hypothetical protein
MGGAPPLHPPIGDNHANGCPEGHANGESYCGQRQRAARYERLPTFPLIWTGLNSRSGELREQEIK